MGSRLIFPIPETISGVPSAVCTFLFIEHGTYDVNKLVIGIIGSVAPKSKIHGLRGST